MSFKALADLIVQGPVENLDASPAICARNRVKQKAAGTASAVPVWRRFESSTLI
jgi:hypothetical protein